MKKSEMVLIGLSPSNGAYHSPAQVQKLFFLIDKNISDEFGSEVFDFQPYNYGPFDRMVYVTLEELEVQGLVEINHSKSWKEYKLSKVGQEKGTELLNSLSPKARSYIADVSEFVRRLTFTQLITAIYKAYPEMRENSVFQG